MARRTAPPGDTGGIDLRRVRTYPLARRRSKVASAALGGVPRANMSIGAFLGSLPDDENDPDVARRRPGSLHELSARRRPAAAERPDDD